MRRSNEQSANEALASLAKQQVETYAGSMEERMRNMERDIAGLKLDVARLLALSATYATKADLHEEISKQTWRILTYVTGFGSLLVAAVYYLARYVH